MFEKKNVIKKLTIFCFFFQKTALSAFCPCASAHGHPGLTSCVYHVPLQIGLGGALKQAERTGKGLLARVRPHMGIHSATSLPLAYGHSAYGTEFMCRCIWAQYARVRLFVPRQFGVGSRHIWAPTSTKKSFIPMAFEQIAMGQPQKKIKTKDFS
jgi:hypothetical protein